MTVARNVFESRPRLSDASGFLARVRLATRRRPSWWREEWDDQAAFVAVALIWTAWTWKRDKRFKQRLADVSVPNGMAVTVLCFVLARQRARSQAWHEASASLGAVSRALTAQRLQQVPLPETLPEVYAGAELQKTAHSETSVRSQAGTSSEATVDALAKQSSDQGERLVRHGEEVGRIAKVVIAVSVVVVIAVAILAASH